ncbi:MAG: type II toxin-antitoxin system HicB family antitoxin [Rhodomicrobium sp.]
MAKTAAEILRKPYGRVVMPEPDGSFRAEIVEFPGCLAVGDTAAEALASLEEVAADWLEIALERGQPIPEPIENAGFSGKLVVRMPKSLHKKAAHLAAREGVSLNQFILSSLAEQVGAQMAPSYHQAGRWHIMPFSFEAPPIQLSSLCAQELLSFPLPSGNQQLSYHSGAS